MTTALVTGTHVSGGLVDLPHDVRFEAGGRVKQGAAWA
jgi:hypothetical protein